MKAIFSTLIYLGLATVCLSSQYVFSAEGNKLYLNDQTFKVIGLRCSNALISDGTTQDLIDHLGVFKSYGVNTVSVFFMGSRFGDVKGYLPDGSLSPVHAKRMSRIIKAADDQGMLVVVGCLYWSTSRAKEDLTHWTQVEADKAVSNTVKWLSEHDYRNVFVDADNEGMSPFSIKKMIDAAHAVDPACSIAFNEHSAPPQNADIYVHHSAKVDGKPWIETEGSPPSHNGQAYWGKFTKASHSNDPGFTNYSRIGRCTSKMKAGQIDATRQAIDKYNGYVLASTWLQCAPGQGVGGPFHRPGGRSNINDVDQDIDTLHSDAGILWWLEFIKETVGPWRPPKPNQSEKHSPRPM
jgi:hypothetical protein